MKRFNRYYLVLILLIVTYGILSFTLPMNSSANARYGLSDSQARALTLTIMLPYIVIWWTAFFGFIKVKQYAALVGQSKDGRALKVLSDGLMLLAISLPLNSIGSTIRNYISLRHPHLTPTTTIMYNYFSLILTLGGMWLVARGARQLAGTLGKKFYTLGQSILTSVFTAFCIFYSYIALTDPSRHTPGETSGTAAYYLPDVMVALTIIIPYILVWGLGLVAAYYIQIYRRHAKGLLYRRALGYLAAGIAFVVASLMVLRLTSSMSSYLSGQSLQFLLGFVYMLLIIIGLGYALIARGAKRLKKIEEV